MYIHQLNEELKNIYGCKVYKLAMSSGCSCPNRDGTVGKRGCIFCDGAGAFAASGTVEEQLAEAKARVSHKIKGSCKYIAYFQSFTNTYGSVERLEPMYREAIQGDDIVALSIATRPDCLGPDVLSMLHRLSRRKPLWVELGLQTIHEDTAMYIRRGFPLSTYDAAVRSLRAMGITVVVHQILGLPNETSEMMAETAAYIGNSGADGIKFHLLHILENTDLADEWRAGRVVPMELSEYIRTLELCVESIPREMVIHRLTGDGAKRDLLAPLWSGDKKRVLNEIHRAFMRDNIEQGRLFVKK